MSISLKVSYANLTSFIVINLFELIIIILDILIKILLYQNPYLFLKID